MNPNFDSCQSDPPVANDDSPLNGRRATPAQGLADSRPARAPSLWLAWAITIGEAILWGALAWVFADYWLMLPVRYRWWGSLILASLAAVGCLRLLRFHRRFLRANKAARKHGPGSPSPGGGLG